MRTTVTCGFKVTQDIARFLADLPPVACNEVGMAFDLSVIADAPPPKPYAQYDDPWQQPGALAQTNHAFSWADEFHRPARPAPARPPEDTGAGFTLPDLPSEEKVNDKDRLLTLPGPRLTMDKSDAQLVERVYAAARGDASASGMLWRMLYLSVVVITTLGLGDVVPLTPLARFLVGTEAIIGPLFFGLYLNALTRQKAQAGSTPVASAQASPGPSGPAGPDGTAS